MVGDDDAKDECLLDVYSLYRVDEDEAMACWKNITRAELVSFCTWFGQLDESTTLLGKAQALLNIVGYIPSLLFSHTYRHTQTQQQQQHKQASKQS